MAVVFFKNGRNCLKKNVCNVFPNNATSTSVMNKGRKKITRYDARCQISCLLFLFIKSQQGSVDSQSIADEFVGEEHFAYSYFTSLLNLLRAWNFSFGMIAFSSSSLHTNYAWILLRMRGALVLFLRRLW